MPFILTLSCLNWTKQRAPDQLPLRKPFSSSYYLQNSIKASWHGLWSCGWASPCLPLLVNILHTFWSSSTRWLVVFWSHHDASGLWALHLFVHDPSLHIWQFPVYCVKVPSGLPLLESMRHPGSAVFLLFCKVLYLSHTCYGNHDIHCDCLFRSVFYPVYNVAFLMV